MFAPSLLHMQRRSSTMATELDNLAAEFRRENSLPAATSAAEPLSDNRYNRDHATSSAVDG